MPRYALTPEEFALIEKVRRKNAETLGYNAGLASAISVIETWPSVDQPREELIKFLNNLKRELVQ